MADQLEQGEQASLILGEAVAALFLVALIAGFLSFVLLRAASRRADAMVTISLSLLTLVAIIGFISTGAETLGTLAGAGMGALAGALTNLFQTHSTSNEALPADATPAQDVDQPPRNSGRELDDMPGQTDEDS